MAGRSRREGIPFLALAEVGGRPNVMADGAALESTVLTLSHWPASPAPDELRHDLSAGMAFRYLRSRRRPAAEVVTTDHFDQDGLVTVAVVSDPAAALAHETALMAVAEAGDFVRGTARPAARASFSLGALAESFAGADPNPALSGELHREALRLLPELVGRPDAHRALWEEEDAFLSASEAAVAAGRVTLSEVPALDLVVVEVAGPVAGGRATQFSHRRPAAVHPMSVHNRSACTRVLVLAPPAYELYFRYETWVRLASRRPPPRVDLAELAAELTAAEPDAGAWKFTGAAATVARLTPEGVSGLAPDRVRSLAERALQRGRPAWDPYAPRPGRA